jgi:uncharacterized protein (TIGR02246 family)
MNSPSQNLATGLLLSLLLLGCGSEPATDATAAPVGAPGGMEDVTAEEREIRRLSDQWTASARAADAAGLANLYAPDATMLEPGMEPIRGRSAILEFYQEMVRGENRQVDSSAERVEVARSGDLAYEYGSYTFAADTPQGRMDDRGRYVAIWKKIDGQWLMDLEITQSTSP